MILNLLLILLTVVLIRAVTSFMGWPLNQIEVIVPKRYLDS